VTSTTPPVSVLPQDPQPTALPQQPVAAPVAQQEPQPDFVEQFRQLGQQQTEEQASLLLARLRATIETDPKLASEARAYGLQFGTDFRWTVENLDAMRQMARYREQQALVAGKLSQAQMALLERERDATVARDEIANLGYLERLTQTARAGYVATELGLLDNMVAQGVPLTPEQETQRDALAGEMKKLPQDDAEMGMGMPLYGLARYAGQFRVQFRESAEEATIGAATGAGVGSLVPGIGTLVGTKIGLAGGFTYGMLSTTKRSETGAAYRSYREMGYDHESSAAAAAAYGWTAMGIEALGTVASFARPLTGPIMGVVKRQALNATMDAIARPTKSKIITDAVINTALGVAGEGGEEAAQQYFEIVGQQWAQQNMIGRGLGEQAPATDFERGEAWGKIGEAAIAGAATWLIPSAGTSAYRMHWDAKRARQAADSKDTLSSVTAAAAQQKLRTDAPDLLREFLATATKGTDAETIYFDARRLVAAVDQLQEQQDRQSRLDGTPRVPIADQLERAAPGLLGRARTAVGDVTIPLADFGANLAGTPLGDELLQHGTLDPEVASPSEAAIAREQAGAQWRGAKAEQMRAEADKLAAADEAIAKSRQQVKDSYLPVLMDGAGYTRREANTVAEMVMAYVTTTAKRLNMLPHEFVAKYPLPFTRRMDAAPTQQEAGEVEAKQPLLFSRDSKYRGLHRAPSRAGGAPLHNLAVLYPDDVYSDKQVRYYGTGDNAMDRASFAVVNAAKGNPEQPVTVFRAIPTGVASSEATINAGDWVTPNREYAVLHGESALRGNYQIVQQTVRAGDLYTDANSIHEWGYSPEASEELRSRDAMGEAPASPMPQSALNVLYGDSAALPKPEKKQKKSEVAKQIKEVAFSFWKMEIDSVLLEERHEEAQQLRQQMEKLRASSGDNADVAALEQKIQELERIEQEIAKNLTDEAVAALRASNRNAADWYTTAIESALAAAAVIHPELSSDEAARKIPAFAKERNPSQAAQFVLRAALAITSQNNTVVDNTKYAEAVYKAFVETGKFVSGEYGGKKTAINNNLKLFNRLAAKLGSLERAEAFARKEFTVRSVMAEASKALGKQIKVTGLQNDIVNGSAIFGPKIGQGFLQNLLGNFFPVTIDLWMRRTWGRMTGDVVGDGITGETGSSRVVTLIQSVRAAKRKLPPELASVRLVREISKKGVVSYSLPESIATRIEEDPDFRQRIIDFALSEYAEWNGIYRLLQQPVTPEMQAEYSIATLESLSEEEKLKAFNRLVASLERQQRKIDAKYEKLSPKKQAALEAELKAMSAAEKKSLGVKGPKDLWLQREYAAAGRTVEFERREATDNVKGATTISLIQPGWVKIAKTIKANLEPIDVPSNADRRVITRVVNDVRRRLAALGLVVTNADVQAILWYPEKDLWSKLQGEDENDLNKSYDDEFLELAAQQGRGAEAQAAVDAVRARRAAGGQVGGAVGTDGRDDGRAVGPVRGRTGEAVPGSGSQGPTQLGDAGEYRSSEAAPETDTTPVPEPRDALDTVEGVARLDEFPVSTKLVRTGKRQMGAGKIDSPKALAQAMAPSIQTKAVEHFDVVLADAKGTPLAVVAGFKGGIDSVSIPWATLIHEVVRVKGAKYAWFVHNHPSGQSKLSKEDLAVAARGARLLLGSGIEPRGIMAISSDGRYEHALGDGSPVETGLVEAAARGKTVPVMERELERISDGTAVRDPLDLYERGKKLLGDDAPGVLFLDTQNRPAGFVSIDAATSRLRNSPTMGMLYRAGSAANARSVAIFNVDKFRDGYIAAANIATFFASHNVQLLDAFNTTWKGGDTQLGNVSSIVRPPGEFFAADRRTLGSFSPAANRITLYRGNNRSTWLHEFGHYWLEVTTAIVGEGNAPSELVNDLGVMFDWLGVQATATQSAVDVWRGMDLEARRKYHERFAYHFEQFLARGEAPSPELHGVFERIGAWIRDVYRGLLEQSRRLSELFREEFGEDLGVLSPEARRVMERIFAADEDIERAAVEREVRTMFQTREEALAAGLSEAAWDELQAEVWLSKERAKDELLEATDRGGRSTIERANREVAEMQKEQREVREEIAGEVAQDVANERVERARLWLRRGQVRNSNGTVTQAAEWQKLDRAAVKAMLGIGTDKPKVSEEQFAKLRGLLADGGQQPDELAAMVGYDSGDQLVRDLIEQPTATEMIDVRTDARVRREHPEFFDSDSRRNRIERAIANDMRRRVLATELLHLQRAVLTSPTMGRLADAAREAFDEANRLEDEQLRLRVQAREIEVLAVDDENYAAARDALRARANKLTDQISRLRRQESGEQTVRTIMAAVRLAAASNLSLRTVREMSPRALNAAAARMARETMQALRAGEFLRAVDLKRRQLVLTEMARQAADFQDELRVGNNLFRRFAKDDEALARTHTMPLIYLGRAVLAGHGLRDPNRDAPTGRDPMQPAHFADAMRMVREMNESLAAELERDVLPSMMRSATGDFRDLTVEEWRGLRDNMEMLWERSRAERTALVDGRREAIEWVEERLLAAPGMTPTTRTAVGVAGGGTTWDKITHELLAGKAARKRIEHWAIQMDGGMPGMWHKAVFQRIADAETRAEQLERTYVTRISRILQRLVPMLRSEPIVWQVGASRTYTFGQRGAVLTGRNGPAMAELFMAVLHAQGNLSNKEKLLLDPRREWGTQAIDPLTGERTLDSSAWDSFFADKVRDGTITKEFLDAAQEIGDVFEEMRPILQAAHVEAFGYPFEVVEPLPFRVVWPDGTTSSYRGWYMPAKADRMLVQDADLQVEDMLTEARTSLAQTPRGMTMSRDPNTFRALSLQLSLLPGHIRESARFAAMGPAIVDVQRLLNRRAIKARIDAINPQLRSRLLAPWVKNAAMLTTSLRDESDTPTQSRLMRRLDRLFTYVTMFGNVINAAQNPLQLFPASTVLIADQGASRAMGAMMSAAAHYSRNPRAMGRTVRSMSPFMNGRGNDEVRDAQKRVEKMLRADENIVERAINLRGDWESYLLDSTYVLQTMTQHIGDQITWKAAYSLEVQKHEDPEVAERLAVAYADSVVRRTQGSLRASDRSAAEVTTPMKALLTKFSGFFVQMHNLMSGMMGAVRQEAGSRNRRLKYLGIYLGVWGLPFALSALLMKAMQGALDDDEDKDGEWWDDLAWDILVESQVRPFAPLFGVGGRSAEAVVNIVDGSPETIGRMPSPAPFALLERGAKAALRAMDGKPNNVTGGDIVSLLVLLGMPVPLPKQAGYAIDVLSGQVDPTVRGAVTGRAAKDERRR
jgi:hypothetical protein